MQFLLTARTFSSLISFSQSIRSTPKDSTEKRDLWKIRRWRKETKNFQTRSPWLAAQGPKVVEWIIGAEGGIGSYRRNVNQTAQRGTQSAYTGSKAMIGGAQVLLPVTSLDVSKGHSLKRRRFPLVEKEVSTGGKFIFHWWKDSFPLVEIRRLPNSCLTHNKKNKQKCLLIVQRPH